jgi:NADPH-dependent glutamate synthase beta subunit-like oxidoreductase
VEGIGGIQASLDLADSGFKVYLEEPPPINMREVCTRPCEEECKRGDFDEPLAIRDIKRFLSEYYDLEEISQLERRREERVAIIGSGPCGLVTAYELVKKGYGVTIFEALPFPGGMLFFGIPEYRLPKHILMRDIEATERMGVEIKLNTRIGEDKSFSRLWEEGYDAILIAVGAQSSRRLGIDGEELEGVIEGVDFLRCINID